MPPTSFILFSVLLITVGVAIQIYCVFLIRKCGDARYIETYLHVLMLGKNPDHNKLALSIFRRCAALTMIFGVAWFGVSLVLFGDR